MVDAKKIYRIEDLDKESTANGDFAQKGESSYNIFMYKGGVNCKHFWMRKIYIRKNNKKITVNRAKQMINDLEPSERKRCEVACKSKRSSTNCRTK